MQILRYVEQQIEPLQITIGRISWNSFLTLIKQ